MQGIQSEQIFYEYYVMPKPTLAEMNTLIEGPAGLIEVQISSPSCTPKAVWVICHPHPQHGGTLDNKVVQTLKRTAHQMGAAAVLFNFRGIGKSVGEYGEGKGECDDLRAVVKMTRAWFLETPLWLAGFSFGAAISILLAKELEASTLISVAPPVPRFDLPVMDTPLCPWWVMMGDKDEIVEPKAVYEWADLQVPKPVVKKFPEASHFFHGHLTALKDSLIESLDL